MKQLILPVIAALLIFAACKKNSDTDIPVTRSSFMFFNGVEGTQFKVMLDTNVITDKVAYSEYTAYKSFRAQKYNIYLYEANNPTQLINGGEINLRNNRYFSAYLFLDTARKQLLMRTTEDDLTSLGEGTGKFRVLNISQTYKPDKSAMNMDVVRINSVKRDTVRYARAVSFATLTPFGAWPANSDDSLYFRWIDSTGVLKQIQFPVQAGKVYTLVTAGNLLDPTKFKVYTIQHN
ncbi:MAG TPA: DUF4397 domain-containing protein [Chitinophaga sp.]|uniref:DUF4397 domain-containing protein n=1 Tax=Chitinophaga sp. TaxID=1869181 RepID=UPI002BF28DDD|nr:DUF4397 domain-containing protein [Chitinophaga sp.]HVI47388.1 DUF4397 domain-containing protein [Chitinophaga sp.]